MQFYTDKGSHCWRKQLPPVFTYCRGLFQQGGHQEPFLNTTREGESRPLLLWRPCKNTCQAFLQRLRTAWVVITYSHESGHLIASNDSFQ
jgi:hypothetical protein